jgi:hypothetical protein
MRCVALGWLSDDAFVFVKSLQAVIQNHTYEMTSCHCQRSAAEIIMQVVDGPGDSRFIVFAFKRRFVPA